MLLILMDILQARQLAQDETTPPEMLEELARSRDYQTRKCVAGNPNTPVVALEKLGSEFPEEITNNPIFYLLLLENPESEFVKLSLARSSTTKPETLAKLAKSKNYIVKQAVARNKSVSSEILEILAEELDPRVLSAITQNPYTPTSILEIVAATAEDIVRDSLLKHPNFTDSVQNVIDFIDGKTARANPSTLEKLSKNPRLKIRRMVADNIDTPANILRQLAREDDSTILECITIHPNTSVDTLESIALRLIEYSRSNQFIKTKSKFYPKYNFSKCYRNIIENKQIKLSTKMQLVNSFISMNYRGMLLRFAQSDYVEPDILFQITESPVIYRNILDLWLYLVKNFNTPNQALETIYYELSKDGVSYTGRNQVFQIYRALSGGVTTPLNYTLYKFHCP